MSEPTSIPFFSPQWADPNDLEKILVQREDLLQESVSLVRDSVLTDNKHHLLFVGSRGSGKSHLVTLIEHRLGKNKALRKKMRVAWLNEDETATSFLRLLVLIYRALSERYPEELSKDTISNLMGTDPATARDQLERRIVGDLEGKVAVVIMENLDSLFHHLPEKEQLSWRAFLQNHPVFTTVGTAQALFKEVSDRDNPFFGFFDTRHLQPLTVDEARSLLEKIALHHNRRDLLEYLQTPAGRSRVVAIRALAGGNPRLYVIFSELLTKAADLDDLVRPFEEMVEQQLTSYYQERLRWLSPQQREIIQLLCRNRHPLTVKKIAEGLFTTHNSITGQLKQLREMGYLSSKQRGREVFYELTEPLMRLALQVKETHNRKPLSLIVDFLRVWYEREELDARMEACSSADRIWDYFIEAKTAIESGAPDLRQEYLRREVDGIDLEHCTDEDLEHLQTIAENSDDPEDWLKLGIAFAHGQKSNKSVSSLSKVIALTSASSEQIAKALICRGIAHGQAGRFDEELTDHTRAIELPGTSAEQVAMALYNRGVAHGKVGRFDEAINDWTRAIELPNAPPDQVAIALNNRGVAHGKVGRFDQAINDWTRAIELPSAPPDQVAIALNNRGVAHGKVERFDEAIADFTRAIELPGTRPDRVAMALNNRGIAHRHAKRIDEAIADYTRAIELPDGLPDQVATALYNRGVAALDQAKSTATLDDWSALLNLPDSKELDELLIPNRLAGMAEDTVESIFSEAADPKCWLGRISTFLPRFAHRSALTSLGEALVKHLPKISSSALNHAAWDAWVETWTRESAKLKPEDREQLDIPLRLLRTGIAYLKSEDEGELLALHAEERAILREALNLPPETAA